MTELSDRSGADQSVGQTAGAGAALEESGIVESTEGEPALEEIVPEVSVAEPLAVRETQRLFRLKAARFVAMVAADTEQEARLLAAGHDALRTDWRNPEFASAEFEDTGEAHVFGDVIISALPPQPNKR